MWYFTEYEYCSVTAFLPEVDRKGKIKTLISSAVDGSRYASLVARHQGVDAGRLVSCHCCLSCMMAFPASFSTWWDCSVHP